MAVTYEKTFEIEIINELSASVYNRVLNYVLNHELNKNDSQLLEVNLLNQLKLAKRVNLFDYSLEEDVYKRQVVDTTNYSIQETVSAVQEKIASRAALLS